MENLFKKHTVLNFNKLIEYTKGGIVNKLVQKSAAGSITLCSLDKGQVIPEHVSAFDVVAQVIDGRADITIGGKHFQVKEGRSIIIPANTTHSLQAAHRFKMQLIIIKGENEQLPLASKEV